MQLQPEKTWHRWAAMAPASGAAPVPPGASGLFALLVTAMFIVSVRTSNVTPILPFMLKTLALTLALLHFHYR